MKIMNGILKNKLTLLLTLSIVVSAITSCKKYPEDKGIHLYRTAQNRLVGTWLVASYSIDGADNTGAYADLNPALTFTIKRNGDYTIYCDGFMIDKTGTKNPYVTNLAGTWQFLEKKKNLALTQGLFSSNIDSYEIRKLTKTELWLRQQKGIVVTEIHYIAK
jgi:hypothetical protein